MSTIASGLSRAALARLPRDTRPRVDPASLRPRIVHLGVGAFHRAHQAVYTERAGGDWGIAAVAPRSAATVEVLRVQDCLYSVTERSAEGSRTAVVGSVVEALLLADNRFDALLTDPTVTVVTLTITEKGYFRRPDGGLDAADPRISAELAGGPVHTVVGRLANALAARMRANGAPISIVSCDNMAANGAATENVIRHFVAATPWADRDRVLGWMDASVCFPSTIVDRIVPATTETDRIAAAVALGVADALPVAGEAYRQWVLEDSFAADRPRWETDGALFVPDVTPYQLTKLRLLNGAHSALAYLGLATGAETISDTMATDWGEPLVLGLAGEVAPTLPADGPDPLTYARDLITRFANPGIRHLLRQIGSDGSLKIPERWLPVLRERRSPLLELALAGWVLDTRPDRATGTTDPAATTLAACWNDDVEATVRRLLESVGAPDLAATDDLVAAIVTHLPGLGAGRVELP
ncbi:mannitol dehydrogenase family protein [Amycolatopsis magusensis]|uniref:mannitol dehydrogenase family protein n=1 Tax=Amycolatopsis magusensis TaxID=882444 RepID=UPI0024A85B01|nr:mannitol dehydrogenase family protein [Amycolatopsis magusensis]MDI5979234.1 mannitol dehydrogenase family protein [Amycolatopsis magusensis]